MDEVLIFSLASNEWAVPAHQVRQALSPRPVTRVPDSVLPLLGLVAWRMRILPVLALGVCLGVDTLPAPDQSDLLVVEFEGEFVALAVDGVRGFVQWSETEEGGVQVLDLEQVLGEL